MPSRVLTFCMAMLGVSCFSVTALGQVCTGPECQLKRFSQAPQVCTGPECAARQSFLPSNVYSGGGMVYEQQQPAVCTGPECALRNQPVLRPITRGSYDQMLEDFALGTAQPGKAREVSFRFPSGEILWVHRASNGSYFSSIKSCLSQRSNYQTAVVRDKKRTYVALKTPAEVYFLTVSTVLPDSSFSLRIPKRDASLCSISIADGKIVGSRCSR